MKTMVLVVVLVTTAAPAFAQAVPQPDPAKLDISRANLTLIAAGIMKLPYEQAQPLLADLQKQLDAQAPKPAPIAEKPKDAGAQ